MLHRARNHKTVSQQVNVMKVYAIGVRGIHLKNACVYVCLWESR